MSRYRNLLAVLATAATTAVLAGCGSGSTHAASGDAASTSPAAPSSAATPTDAAGLAQLLEKSNASVSSAHLTMTVAAGSVVISGVGNELLSQGKLKAMDLTETVPKVGELRVLIAAGKTYLKLPASVNHAVKPWVLVSPTSSNPVVRRLGTTLQSIEQTTSLDQFTAFTSAARIARHMQETLDGAQVTHYVLSVDLAKLPASLPGKQQLTAAGLTTLPVDLWVDQRGRMVKFVENLDVKGQHVATTLNVGQYNAPVTVTPPPADQVATD